MEGYTLLRKLRELINESGNDGIMNDRTSYDYLYDAVQDFNVRTHYITNTQTISIVPGTNVYDLNPDYTDLALYDSFNRKYIQWTVGSDTSFVYPNDYTNTILSGSGAVSSSVAESFSIAAGSFGQQTIDYAINLTGVATSTSVAVDGESTLTTGSDLSTVSVGDFVHNRSAQTSGVVISTSASVTNAITTAMFNDGQSGGGWFVGDNYTIVRQPRYQIIFSTSPTVTASVAVNYIKRPDPVYSMYRAYRLPFSYTNPIVQYAAFLYKYKDEKTIVGDNMFKYYDLFCKKVASEMRRGSGERQGMRCNFSKVNARSKSLGNFSR